MTTGSPLFKGNGAKIPKGRRNFTYMYLPDLPESPYLGFFTVHFTVSGKKKCEGFLNA